MKTSINYGKGHYKMKIKPGFIVSKVGKDNVAVPTGALSKTFSNMITLNGSALFLWKKLSSGDGCSREQLLSDMLEEYDVERSVAEGDIDTFIETLRASDLIID